MLIDQRAVAAGDSYTVSGIAAAQNRYLTITNDSPFDISYYFDNNSTDARTLAPGGVVDNEEPAQAAPSLTPSLGWNGGITVTVAQPLGGMAPSNPPAQQVTLEGFSQPRRVARSSLARVVNVGNAVTVGTSTLLEGSNQLLGVSERDVAVPNANAGSALYPAVAQSGGTPIGLFPADANGNPNASAGMIARPADVLAQSPLTLLGAILAVGGVTTAGAFGVPVIVASSGLVAVTLTTLQTILNFATVVNGLYRASVYALIANSISGNACTLQASWFAGSARTADFTLTNGATQAVAAGVTALANGGWAGAGLTFFATSGGAIQITYRDPTNTPNDTVIAVLERLA